MSQTIRVNDKSDVVHSLGKHSLHKRETGRQTLTCPKLITRVEANKHRHTHSHMRTLGSVDMLRQCVKLCPCRDKTRFAQKKINKNKKIPPLESTCSFFFLNDKITTTKWNCKKCVALCCGISSYRIMSVLFIEKQYLPGVFLTFLPLIFVFSVSVLLLCRCFVISVGHCFTFGILFFLVCISFMIFLFFIFFNFFCCHLNQDSRKGDKVL